mgnify:CR=1 FL=1
MKIKLLILGLGLGASILAGCNDDFSSIGTSIQPGDDTIAVYMDTFQIQATTVQLDSIYARSTSAQLGELYDPLYGNLVSDYIVRVIFNLSIHLMREKLIRWNSIYIIMVPIKTVYG